MKTLVLTAMGSEQTFANGGGTKYFLVFNDGEFRIPCSEQQALDVISILYGTETKKEAESEDREAPIPFVATTSDDDASDYGNGIDQI